MLLSESGNYFVYFHHQSAISFCHRHAFGRFAKADYRLSIEEVSIKISQSILCEVPMKIFFVV